MLLHLTIDNVAIADHLEVEFHPGMSAVTGETGAGKSIMLDALGLALGDRADSSAVRPGAERADIHASFDIRAIPAAKQWLSERELQAGDDCLLRRVVTAEGRSRGFINGRPATMQDLREIGELLVDIHSQHAHQSLLRKPQQRALLDAYAGTTDALDTLAGQVAHYRSLRERLEQRILHRDEHSARAQLLAYQVEELDGLALGPDELPALEQEQKQLANGDGILQACQHALALCREGELNVASILGQALRSLAEVDPKTRALSEAEQMLDSARIQVEEASHNLQGFLDDFELDPARMRAVEERLDAIYQLARKHRLQPEQLAGFHAELRAELAGLGGGDSDIEALSAEVDAALAACRATAAAVSKARSKAANQLQKLVEKQLQALAMGGCRFRVALTPLDGNEPHPQGAEDVEFLIATNPGSEPAPLGRIASGGELSRISLAIQVATAQSSAVPTLVFDEVDVGIGGATAEVVGNLLRELGSRSQVICVTHQAQVASKAQQHLSVRKTSARNTVRTTVQPLQHEEKIQEIARMLGGLQITDQSLAHAREMLNLTH
ncbi:MAG TPA: DNA repair protein RecN [Spongiibacteraceae bacterium]|jgi:DNA repair protein RecN (Recombination protein N)|nr:DNA repair protein RecN [Spongiibacteraceae bacterium]HUH36806.1 DNA repair protein RecN [Spongiibacteraceae bacterium]